MKAPEELPLLPSDSVSGGEKQAPIAASALHRGLFPDGGGVGAHPLEEAASDAADLREMSFWRGILPTPALDLRLPRAGLRPRPSIVSFLGPPEGAEGSFPVFSARPGLVPTSTTTEKPTKT